MARSPIQPYLMGEVGLSAAWAPRATTLELLASTGASPIEISRSYAASYPPEQSRAEIVRAIRATQSVVVTQNAMALSMQPDELRARADLPIDPDLVAEIELGLARMVQTWLLDYSRALITSTVHPIHRRADATPPSIPIAIHVTVPVVNSTHDALVMLALEALRRAKAAGLVDLSELAMLAQAAELADLAELAMLADTPTAAMLRAVDMVTNRTVYTPPQRQERATNTQERLSRRTVTQTQATASKDVQTSVGINEYKWVSQRDGRVRPLHVTLDKESRNGTTFSWSNPNTHGEGNPGDPYGCRCVAVPVIGGKTPFLPEVSQRP